MRKTVTPVVFLRAERSHKNIPGSGRRLEYAASSSRFKLLGLIRSLVEPYVFCSNTFPTNIRQEEIMLGTGMKIGRARVNISYVN